jgi:hypothetical protein
VRLHREKAGKALLLAWIVCIPGGYVVGMGAYLVV